MINKLYSFLSISQKKNLVVIIFLMIVGMLAEMLGIGVIIPLLSLLSKSSKILENSRVANFLNYIGNPSYNQIVLFSMGLLVLIYIIKAIYLIYLSWVQSRFSTNLSVSVTQKLFQSYLNQPYSFHLKNNSAILLKNVQGDANEIMHICQAYINITLELSAIFGISAILFYFDPYGALVVILSLVFFSWIYYRISRKRVAAWGEQKNILQGLKNQHILQGLGGIKDIKVLGREQMFYQKFKEVNDKNAIITIKYSVLTNIPRFYLELLAITGLSLLIIIQVIQLKSIETILPIIGIFLAAAFRMIPSVNRLIGAMQLIKHSSTIIENVYSELNNFPVYKSIQEENYMGFNEKICINNIVFKYPNTQSSVLKDINFEILKGQTLGIIGKSGSGKSTLVDLIIGLNHTTSGTIHIDNMNLNSIEKSWQKKIGYVPQTIYLTDDTLKNNIALGMNSVDIDDNLIDDSLKKSNLYDYVFSLKDKSNTLVGERGVRLSGGQRQRIGIARALYNKPDVLILDEATSALDTETEKNVMSSVMKLSKSITIIIVAHRISTVMNCDKIIEIEDGRIKRIFTPEELSIK